MPALPFVLVASLAFCMMPTALSLQCYECYSHPQFSGGLSCSSGNVTKRTCPQVSGIRCMTMKYIASSGIGAPQTLEQRNCTAIQACDPQSVHNPCKQLSNNSMISNCTYDCCQGDLCNMVSSTSMPTSALGSTPSVVQSTTPKPSRAALGLAANLGAILLTLILPKIVGSN